MSQEERKKCSWQSYLCSILNIFNHTGSPHDKQTLSQIKTHFKTFLICKILKLNLQKLNPNIQKGIVPFLKLHWSTIAHKARSCWYCQPFSEDGQTLSQINTLKCFSYMLNLQTQSQYITMMRILKSSPFNFGLVFNNT